MGRMRAEKRGHNRKRLYISICIIILYTKALYFEYLMSSSGTRMDDAFAEPTQKPFPAHKNEE